MLTSSLLTAAKLRLDARVPLSFPVKTPVRTTGEMPLLFRQVVVDYGRTSVKEGLTVRVNSDTGNPWPK